MQMEADAVADALQIRRPKPAKPSGGALGGVEVSITLIGIGARSLPDGPMDSGPDVVLLAGFSGALDPSLRVADIVVDASQADLLANLPFRCGRITPANEILATPAQKADRFAATGALAIDMESGIVRAWADAQAVPLLVIRSISDGADQVLNPAALRWVDVWGRARIGAILRSICRNPLILPYMIRLGRDSRRAAASLGAATKQALGCLLREYSDRS